MTNDRFAAPFLGDSPFPGDSQFLGDSPRTLSRHVSLATPFTLSRVTGRDRVGQALLSCAAAFGLERTGTRLYGDQAEGLTHVVRAGGPAAQVLTVSGCDQAGRITSVDMYGRSWPQMSLVRDRLAAGNPSLAGLGVAGVAEDAADPGPESARAMPLRLPAVADDVLLWSPIAATPARGRDELQRYLDAAITVHGELKYHAILGVHGENAIVALCDGVIRGSVLRLAVLLSLDNSDALQTITFFSRPWTVTGLFRVAMQVAAAPLVPAST